MTEYFLPGDDGESLDSVIAEALALVLDEARRVVDAISDRARQEPSPPPMPCHPALAVDWTEGDAGFVDWSSHTPSDNGYGMFSG